MNQLYPMIRRVRRPLWPPEAQAALVVPVSQAEASVSPSNATGQRPAVGTGVAEPASASRADARRSKLKEKAE